MGIWDTLRCILTGGPSVTPHWDLTKERAQGDADLVKLIGETSDLPQRLEIGLQSIAKSLVTMSSSPDLGYITHQWSDPTWGRSLEPQTEYVEDIIERAEGLPSLPPGMTLGVYSLPLDPRIDRLGIAQMGWNHWERIERAARIYGGLIGYVLVPSTTTTFQSMPNHPHILAEHDRGETLSETTYRYHHRLRMTVLGSLESLRDCIDRNNLLENSSSTFEKIFNEVNAELGASESISTYVKKYEPWS